jgi:hypothetical protein
MSLDYTDKSVHNVQGIVVLSTTTISRSLSLSHYEENADISSAAACGKCGNHITS